MKQIVLIGLMILPFITYSYAQENQTVQMEVPSSLNEINNTENYTVIENQDNFLPYTLLDLVLIGSGFATIIFVIILWHQSKQTEKSMKLGYGPVIHGRFGTKEGYPRLFLKNYGKGPALDVQITIETPEGISLEKVRRFALTPEDGLHPTNVDLAKNPRVVLKGTFKDVNFKIQKLNHVLDYPFMEEIGKHEKEEVKDE